MKGLITFTRSMPDGLIYIRLTDELSGVDFLNIEMRPEDFAAAIMNSQRECDFKLHGLQFVGKRREHKKEIVTIPENSLLTDEIKRESVKPFEVDGWMGFNYRSTIGNHHYQRGRNRYDVSFVRFVDIESAEAEEDSNDAQT